MNAHKYTSNYYSGEITITPGTYIIYTTHRCTCILLLFTLNRDSMIPDPFIVISDHVQYKVRLTYRQWDYLTGNDEGRKQQVFSWIHEQISQFRAKNEPQFDASKMGDFMLLRADQSGYQNTQMSQESLHIEQRDGCVIRITDHAFSGGKCERPSNASTQESSLGTQDEDVMITNDDNADVSLPFYERNVDHTYSSAAAQKLNPTKSSASTSKPVSSKTGGSKKTGKQILPKTQTKKPMKQLSILNMLQNADEEEETEPNPDDDDYDETEDNMLESDELDDIPHTMDPIIERFRQTQGITTTESQTKQKEKSGDVIRGTCMLININ